MSMLGSRGADTTLSTLSNLIANPAKLQRAMANLQAATEKHRAERDAAIKQKADAAEAVANANARLANLEQRETDVRAAEGRAAATKQAVLAEQASLARQKSAFYDEQTKAALAYRAKVDDDWKKLADAKFELEQDKAKQEIQVNKAMVALKDQQAKLDARLTQLDRQRDELDRRGQALTELELDVRSRIKKINELFPIT